MIATLSTIDSATGIDSFDGQTDGILGGLASDVAGALDRAFWTLDFQGDLEEALDAALLRAALASTPMLSNDLFAAAVAA